MKRAVVIHERAQADVEAALAFYDREAPHVTSAFIDSLEAAVAFIQRTPGAASPRFAHELDWPGLRSVELKGFPWSVFILEQERELAVLRVLHHARDLALLLEPEG